MVRRKAIKLEDGSNVVLEMQNCRQLKVSPFKNSAETWDEKNLVGLNFNDEFVVEIKGVVKFQDRFFKVQRMVKNDSKAGAGYYLYSQTLTKSSNFITPMLGHDKIYFKWNKNLCNVFIGMENLGDYGDKMYLMYKYDPSMEFKEFEKNMKRHEDFDKTIEPDQHHVIYSFNIPKKYKDDFDKILKGKYSYVSEEYKQRILDFHKTVKDKDLGQILYRSEKRRLLLEKEYECDPIPEECDLYSLMEPEDEVFLNDFIIEKESSLGGIEASKGEFE